MPPPECGPYTRRNHPRDKNAHCIRFFYATNKDPSRGSPPCQLLITKHRRRQRRCSPSNSPSRNHSDRNHSHTSSNSRPSPRLMIPSDNHEQSRSQKSRSQQPSRQQPSDPRSKTCSCYRTNQPPRIGTSQPCHVTPQARFRGYGEHHPKHALPIQMTSPLANK